MKTALAAFGISGLMLLAHPSEAKAALVTQVLSFSPARSVVDTASGSQPNFTYEHLFDPPPQGAEILGGRLILTHSGNSNSGPTQEIWRVLSGLHTLGTLNASDRAALTEFWDLPMSVLSSIVSGNIWRLELSLMEDTPFNSERFDLSRSELSLEYREPLRKSLPAAPSVPEPATVFLLGLGAVIRGVFQKVSREAETD